MPPFYLLSLENVSIFDQLQIEEALVRVDNRNWIIVNCGAPPAIVMGISGKHVELINREKIEQMPIPIIRRFSGGGTVVIDQQTLFFTLIGNRSLLDFPCYPKELMQWTEALYLPAFDQIPFRLCDHDYVIDHKKFGGNAQYLSKERWLHHSSLLWDYTAQLMDYLLLPPKMPNYRQKRSHEDFLCSLKHYFSTVEFFKTKMLETLEKRFKLIPTTLSSIESILEVPHRRSTKFESFNECFTASI